MLHAMIRSWSHRLGLPLSTPCVRRMWPRPKDPGCAGCEHNVDVITTIIAILGLILAMLSLGWQAYTWRSSGSRVQVETSVRIFPGLVRNQMMDRLIQAQAGLPPDLASAAQQMIQQHSQIVLPPDLGYPASDDLMAVLPPDSIMVVATIRNTGRLPVTIQRCQWQTSQPGTIESPRMPPGVSFPHRLGEHDQCSSVIDLASIMSLLDAPLRDTSVTGRHAWPLVEIANRREPVCGNRLAIPTRRQPPSDQATAP